MKEYVSPAAELILFEEPDVLSSSPPETGFIPRDKSKVVRIQNGI